MSLEKLIEESSRRILDLEYIKGHQYYDPEELRRYALEAALAEARVYEAEKGEGALGQDLAITLISQASCLIDASQIKEALEIYEKAYEHAQTSKLKIWIRGEIGTIQGLMKDAPDY